MKVASEASHLFALLPFSDTASETIKKELTLFPLPSKCINCKLVVVSTAVTVVVLLC